MVGWKGKFIFYYFFPCNVLAVQAQRKRKCLTVDDSRKTFVVLLKMDQSYDFGKKRKDRRHKRSTWKPTGGHKSD